MAKKILKLQFNKAFTLIEVMAVVFFLSILSVSVIEGYEYSIKKMNESALKQELLSIRNAVDRFYLDNLRDKPELKHLERFPKTLDELVKAKYLRAIPKDPITKKNDWKIIYTSAETYRIYDIKSCAMGAASDGTLYSEW